MSIRLSCTMAAYLGRRQAACDYKGHGLAQQRDRRKVARKQACPQQLIPGNSFCKALLGWATTQPRSSCSAATCLSKSGLHVAERSPATHMLSDGMADSIQAWIALVSKMLLGWATTQPRSSCSAATCLSRSGLFVAEYGPATHMLSDGTADLMQA